MLDKYVAIFSPSGEVSSPLDCGIGPMPENNFLCGARARLLNNIDAHSCDANRYRQTDVYSEARAIATEAGISRVIDFGCGDGRALMAEIVGHGINATGLDFQRSLSAARGNFPSADWRECDLTDRTGLQACIASLEIAGPTLFIVGDVIGCLSDPRPLFCELRTLLLADSRSRLVVSTPVRDRLNDQDLPINPAHQREWTFEELRLFFLNSGFVIESAYSTHSGVTDDELATSLFVLSADPIRYLEFLKEAGLMPGASLPTRVIVTTEMHGLVPSGGVGTYVELQRDLDEHDRTLVLLVGDAPANDAPVVPAVLAARRLLGSAAIDKMPAEDQAFAGIEQLLFFLPALESVHYQDFLGIGCRIAQAKTAGVLPNSLTTVAHCHGTTLYLDNAQERWTGLSPLSIPEKEKVALEHSDIVLIQQQVSPQVVQRGRHPHSGVQDRNRSYALRFPTTRHSTSNHRHNYLSRQALAHEGL